MTDTPQPPKRKRTTKYGPESSTKPKGSPVVSEAQASKLFGAPNGNRPGITSETAKLRVRNAEIAARLSNTFLASLDKITQDALNAGTPATVLESLTTNALNLMKDAMDREYGRAQASVDVTSKGESMAPKSMSDFYAMTKEADDD